MKGILVAMLALTLSACGDDRWTDYSYKMTVYVGDKAYSTVRHVEVEEGSTIQSSTGRRVDRRVEGEAVVIDTPSGPVFALMTPAKGGFGNGYYAAYVAEPALMVDYGKPSKDVGPRWGEPGYDGLADDAKRHNAMLKVEGPRNLPRSIPELAYVTRSEFVVWPMFVRFSDINNPNSVQQVSPESIGVTRISIEVTRESVTEAVASKLTWLSQYQDDGRSLSGSTSIAVSSKGLAENLGVGDFKQDGHR